MSKTLLFIGGKAKVKDIRKYGLIEATYQQGENSKE